MNKVALHIVRFAANLALTIAHHLTLAIDETDDGPAREALRDALACVNTGHGSMMAAIRLTMEVKPQ